MVKYSGKESAIIEAAYKIFIQSLAKVMDAEQIAYIEKAYRLALAKYDGKKTLSGGLFLLSLIEMADIAANEVGLRSKTVVGIFLHGITSGTDVTLDYIREHFGDRIALIVDGYEKISNIQIDDFATKMFQAGNNFSKKTPEEIFYQDYKKFVVEDISFGIGQISFMSKESLAAVKTILLPYIEKEYSRTGVQMAFFMLTSILEESTELLCYGKGSGQLIQNAYGISLENHCAHLENVVSRKKQLLPKLMYALQT